MDVLLMSTRERRRLTELSLVKQGRSSVAEAAGRLGLSERQTRRLWKRYKVLGDAGIVHALRGRKGNAGKRDLREKAVALCRERYASFNAAHASEMLQRKEKLSIPRQTLWRWLKAEGLIEMTRRVRKHRRRRERKACVGELIQMDGSTHAWFGPEHPACVLFVMVDDASGKVFARFYESEDTASAFDLFGRYARQHGLPLALYVDHDSIYVVNDAQAKERARQAWKKPPLTQFGRAMEELGVRIICAHSPQAKGRVERMNRTLQDRLLKERALELGARGIHDLAAANDYLESEFLPHFNQRFTRPPANGTNLHRALPKGVKLEEVLCLKDVRVVGQDWCVRFANRILQIARRHEVLKLAGKAVEVWQSSDGTLRLCHRGTPLRFAELASRPVPAPTDKPARESVINPPYKPPANHPWRTGLPRRVPASAPLQSASLRSTSFRSADAGTPTQE
jgi:hypothetical protein